MPAAVPEEPEGVVLDMFGLPVRKGPPPAKKTATAVGAPAPLEKPTAQPKTGLPVGHKPCCDDEDGEYEQGGPPPPDMNKLKDFSALTIIFGLVMWPAFWICTYHWYYDVLKQLSETYKFELPGIRPASFLMAVMRPHSRICWIVDSILFRGTRPESALFYGLDRGLTHLIIFPYGTYIICGWIVQFFMLPTEDGYNLITVPFAMLLYTGHWANLKVFWKNGSFALVTVNKDGTIANGSMAFSEAAMKGSSGDLDNKQWPNPEAAAAAGKTGKTGGKAAKGGKKSGKKTN